MTVLFADLVGFTSRAESLDPEDVDAILRPYHEQLRSELERHGGIDDWQQRGHQLTAFRRCGST